MIMISTAVCLALTAQQPPPASADTLLQSGLSSYRAGSFRDAATELSAAASAYLSPEQMEKYVSSGKFENLAGFETALVYLALAQSKLGNQDAARESILRLTTAERIAPTFAALKLDADAADFTSIAHRLVPDSTLPPNTQLATLNPPAAQQTAQSQLPTTVVSPPESSVTETPAPAQTASASPSAPLPIFTAPERSSEPPAVTTVQTAVSETPPPVQIPVSQPSLVTQAPVTTPVQPTQTAAEASAERERYIEQRLAEERAKIERAAEERVASERMAIQKEADERVAAAQRAAEERLAAERATLRTTSTDRVDTMTRRDYLTRLRDAEDFVANGEFRRAAAMYSALSRQPGAPRDILAEAATGLYRTGAYDDAVEAFNRLGTFAHGEEDLRFYHAVSLYETGQYDAARRELSCAIPFIQVTDEVARYRVKIEQMPRSSTSDRNSPAT